jgi:hypothetical protein
VYFVQGVIVRDTITFGPAMIFHIDATSPYEVIFVDMLFLRRLVVIWLSTFRGIAVKLVVWCTIPQTSALD